MLLRERRSLKGFESVPRCSADAALANTAAHISTHLRTVCRESRLHSFHCQHTSQMLNIITMQPARAARTGIPLAVAMGWWAPTESPPWLMGKMLSWTPADTYRGGRPCGVTGRMPPGEFAMTRLNRLPFARPGAHTHHAVRCVLLRRSHGVLGQHAICQAGVQNECRSKETRRARQFIICSQVLNEKLCGPAPHAGTAHTLRTAIVRKVVTCKRHRVTKRFKHFRRTAPTRMWWQPRTQGQRVRCAVAEALHALAPEVGIVQGARLRERRADEHDICAEA